MGIFPQDELRRKLFHLLTTLYIGAYWFLPRSFVLSGMAVLTIVAVAGEIARLRSPAFNAWILAKLGSVHRDEELHKVSGLPWTLSGSFLTMLLFHDQTIVLVSLFYLAFGDAFAALVGRQIGRIRLFNGRKTLEGSIACFIACLVVGLFFFDWRLAVIGALVATSLEIVPWPLNDNFWMPLTSAAALTLLVPYIR
jgi:dolichol kinase